ncbi:MAG: flagellar motor switch protein FliN [Vicinamibacterales bacterium]
MSGVQAAGHDLITAFVEELGKTLSALTGASVAPKVVASASSVEWSVTVTLGEPWRGHVDVGFRRDDCVALVKVVIGDQSEPSEGGVSDFLKELVGQAVGGLRERPESRGALFCVEQPSPRGFESGGTRASYEVVVNDDLKPIVSVNCEIEEPSATQGRVAASPPAMSVVGREEAQAAVPANLEVILDIDLPLSVRFGRTDMSLEALTRLGPGSVIDLGRSPDDPVEVLVNGRLIARAEVVVVAGNYGVRIIEVVSAADRVRSLSA